MAVCVCGLRSDFSFVSLGRVFDAASFIPVHMLSSRVSARVDSSLRFSKGENFFATPFGIMFWFPYS